MFIFGVGRRCPGISRHAPRAAGPSLRSRGAGGTGAARSLPRASLSSCALRRRRSSPRSAWRWRPPQEPQVGAAAGGCPSAPPPAPAAAPRGGRAGGCSGGEGRSCPGGAGGRAAPAGAVAEGGGAAAGRWGAGEEPVPAEGVPAGVPRPSAGGGVGAGVGPRFGERGPGKVCPPSIPAVRLCCPRGRRGAGTREHGAQPPGSGCPLLSLLLLTQKRGK